MPLPANVILAALVIFIVRVFSITLSTIRLLIMGRAGRVLVAGIAFVEALTFALTFGAVAADLTNIWNLAAYCGGFAAGTWVGMIIEERLGQGFSSITIISTGKSLPLVEAIHKAGFGATRTSGEGAAGNVGMIWVVARRRDVSRIVKIIDEVDPKAFVTIGEARSVWRGFMGYGRS
jgi:uncharacterized protein YebE (UPF0316 family)